MREEKGMVILISLVAFGIILISGLIAYFHTTLALPIIIMGIIFAILILSLKSHKQAVFTENLEKLVFAITLIIIIISFIVLYKPV